MNLDKDKKLELFDLRYPQESFTKNYIPKGLGKTDKDSLKKLLSGKKFAAANIHFYSTASSALSYFIESLSIKNHEICTLGGNVFESLAMTKTISTDPDLWQDTELKDIKLFIWSHPNLLSGEYLPQLYFERAYKILRQINPDAYILIDQRSHSICWEHVGPGMWDKSVQSDGKVAILDSTEPVLAPSKFKQLSWLKAKNTKLSDKCFHTEEDLAKVFYVMASYKSMQGSISEELHRKTLVARESLKRISNQFLRENAKVTVWPAAGYFLKLSFENELEAKRFQQRFESLNVKLMNGAAYGDNTNLYLSYAMHLSQVDRLLKLLTKS